MWLIDSHNQPDRRAPAGCKFATSSRRCSMTRIWCPARGSGRWYWCPQPGDRSTSSTTTPGNPEVQRCGRHSRVSSRAPYSRRAAATFVRDPSLRLATRSGVPGLLCVARRPVLDQVESASGRRGERYELRIPKSLPSPSGPLPAAASAGVSAWPPVQVVACEIRGTHSSEPLTSISLGHPKRTAVCGTESPALDHTSSDQFSTRVVFLRYC
jgi:hypothetical protein